MRNWLHLLLSAPLLLTSAVSLRAQSLPTPAVPETSPPLKLDYPDSAAGLEHLVKDILKAQKENDPARADLLLRSLILPQPRAWYARVFGPGISEQASRDYEQALSQLPASVAELLLDATEKGTDLVVKRFDKSCDDEAGLEVFGTLQLRLQTTPFYEVRLIHSPAVRRLFAFAYVDGGFRLFFPPSPDDSVFDVAPSPDSPPPAMQVAQPAGTPPARLKVPAAVQEAKLIHGVQPAYPMTARMEQLEGVVRMRALIDKDGSVEKLIVLQGYCSLAESAVETVRHWKYSPTLVRGQPVEVDTQIDIVFHLPEF